MPGFSNETQSFICSGRSFRSDGRLSWGSGSVRRPAASDVEVFKSAAEAEYCNTLVLNGTSADHQLRAGGNDNQLDKVKDWIARATIEENLEVAA